MGQTEVAPSVPTSPAASGTLPAIELIGVNKEFLSATASVVAVEDVDLQVAAGEFFSLLGPSGCGKTTTLRMLAGFDEPLGALDLKLRRAMQLELKRIQREVGITFVYVTHDQEEALTMSDRLAVMNAGRIEQLGTPKDLYERPATRFVADFLGTSNILAGRLQPAGDGWALAGLGAGERVLMRGTDGLHA